MTQTSTPASINVPTVRTLPDGRLNPADMRKHAKAHEAALAAAKTSEEEIAVWVAFGFTSMGLIDADPTYDGR